MALVSAGIIYSIIIKSKNLNLRWLQKENQSSKRLCLEAKSLEDALKANTKEMLATHMKQEIESIVESSLKKEGVNDGRSEVNRK